MLRAVGLVPFSQHRSIAEKVSALAEAAGTVLGGGSVQTVIGSYRFHLQANEVRLLGPDAR
jgi:hypothetical protein